MSFLLMFLSMKCAKLCCHGHTIDRRAAHDNYPKKQSFLLIRPMPLIPLLKQIFGA